MKKRFFMLAAVLLAAAALCLSAQAEGYGGSCGDDTRWTLDPEAGLLTISGTGPMEEYFTYVPDGDYWSVSSPPWKKWNEELTEEENLTWIRHLVIGEGVTTVGSGAFLDMPNLEDVRIADTVTAIGTFAFENDPALKEIAIPAAVTAIGDRAFYECTGLTNISVDPESRSFRIADGALLTADGTELICYCPGRTASSFTVPDGVKVIRPSAFSYTSALESVELPDSLVEIKDWAFGHTGLKSVVLPQNLEILRYCVFGAAQVETASLPVSLKLIEEWVFGDCPLKTVYYEGTGEQWSAIEMLEDNEALLDAERYYSARIYCAHESLTFRAAVWHTCTQDGTIAHWTCDACGAFFLDSKGENRVLSVTDPASHSYVSTVTLEPNCAEPGIRTFTCTECGADTEGHSFTEEIPATYDHDFHDGYCTALLHDGVTVCGTEARITGGTCGTDVFWQIDGSGALHIYGEGAMKDPTAVTVYNHGVPMYTRLMIPWDSYSSEIKAVIIGKGVTYVSEGTFYNMPALENIRLPATLTRINRSVFSGNTSLRDIYYTGTRREWYDNVGRTVEDLLSGRDITVHCTDSVTGPLFAEGTCGENLIWHLDSAGTLTISGTGPMAEYTEPGKEEDSLRLLAPPWWNAETGKSAEENRNSITRVVIEEGVTSIGSGAFRDLTRLQQVQIADSVASVGQWAFYHDPMLRELSLPAAVSEIGDRAFYDCTALADIRVDPENAAFRSADGALLTMDGTELVCYCPGRPQTSFTVPDGVKLIRPSAFSYTAALEWVDLPDSLEEIGNWAFGHTGLRGIVLPESVRTVRYCAFSGTPMETAALPAALSLIEEYVFGERPLAHVCYWGTRTQWDGMEITDDNEALLGAALHLISGSRILLPEQLTVIGEEAFAGGSFTQVYLKPSVTEIGKRAFADCAQLAFIRIPASCAAIAADAFEGCGDTVIACAADSPAYRYAAEHGMAYLIVN